MGGNEAFNNKAKVQVNTHIKMSEEEHVITQMFIFHNKTSSQQDFILCAANGGLRVKSHLRSKP